MADKRVAVVVGDIGATAELIPAVQEMERRGVAVQWFADPAGKGYTMLDAAGIHWCEHTLPSFDIEQLNLILIGTSATAVQAQIEWTLAGEEAYRPVVWYEDLWGTGERPVTRLVDPNVMLVVDEMAGRIARNVRPQLQVEVVGKPTFEYLHNLCGDQIWDLRRACRQQMGIAQRDDSQEFVLVYWGGGDLDRVVAHMAALRTVVVYNGLTFAPRLHPKMPARDDLWTCLRHMFGKSCLFDSRGEFWTEERLNCAADAVIGEFGSTQTYAAALVGTKPIIALWPDNHQKRLDCGFVSGDPPLTAEGIGVGVESKEAFRLVVNGTIFAENGQRSETYRRARTAFGQTIQPGAAGRIADAVMKYV